MGGTSIYQLFWYNQKSSDRLLIHSRSLLAKQVWFHPIAQNEWIRKRLWLWKGMGEFNKMLLTEDLGPERKKPPELSKNAGRFRDPGLT